MTRLDDLFFIKAGLPSTRVTVSNIKTRSSIAYLRPAKTQQRTLAGWVEQSTVPSEHRHPMHTLFVSTNGEGSHTYAYVSTFEFAANSDVSVLLPKREMSLAEKIFYAKSITLNRGKFSYGRKPKGERLKSIELPNTPPDWVKKTIDLGASFGGLPNFPSDAIQRRHHKVAKTTVRLCDLFEVNYGSNLELNAMIVNPHGITLWQGLRKIMASALKFKNCRKWSLLKVAFCQSPVEVLYLKHFCKLSLFIAEETFFTFALKRRCLLITCSFMQHA